MILIHVSLGSAWLSTKTAFLSLFLCAGRLSLTKQWRGFWGRVIKVNFFFFFTFFLCGDCEALLMRTTCLCALHERSFSFFKSQRFEMWAVLGLAKGDLRSAWAGEFVAASAASGLGLCAISLPPVRLEAPSSDCKEVRDQSPFAAHCSLRCINLVSLKGSQVYLQVLHETGSHTPELSSCPYLSARCPLSVALLLPAAQQGFLLSSFLLIPGSISDHPICPQSSHSLWSHNSPSSRVFSSFSEHSS